VSDDVRRLSEELARDPSSLAFIPLGEALRRQGQLDMALKVALRGLEKHPHHADAHDLLARISVERGELERAFDEWDMVLRLTPGHAGALKGMGFVRFQQGNFAEAERYLAEAQLADVNDMSIAAALAHVRTRGASPDASPRARAALTPRSTPAIVPAMTLPAAADGATHAQLARSLFVDLVGDGGQTALLLDAEGFVLAGAYVTADGQDVGQDVGAQLSGVSDEAARAMRHLDLGAWTSIVFETEVATFAMAPGPQDGLLLVAADRQTPIGFVRRVLDHAGERARQWVQAMSGRSAGGKGP
jgi:tetratricopeptide (TPR) repeat protein